MNRSRIRIGSHNIDLVLMGFIFILLFILPVIFTRVDGRISWTNVLKIWQDRALLIPVFVINHWLLVPKLMIRKQYRLYLAIVSAMVLTVTVAYYLHDLPGKNRPPSPPGREQPQEEPGPQRQAKREPTPVPPFADLLMFSLLIVAVDTGLLLSKNWHKGEEDRIRLEKENINVQLAMLRHQISPHFFMNTLNNIYALIDSDSKKSKEAVMKLSKLMRYMLYENKGGKVHISKEFEFIRSYVDLMSIRYAGDIRITLDIPELYTDVEIPVMLFISYIENAFKHGTSYEQSSFIHVIFEITGQALSFTCINSKSARQGRGTDQAIGLENSRQRIHLLYGDNHKLSVHETEKTFTVELTIPLGDPVIPGRKAGS